MTNIEKLKKVVERVECNRGAQYTRREVSEILTYLKEVLADLEREKGDNFDSPAGATQCCMTCEHTAKQIAEFRAWLEENVYLQNYVSDIQNKLKELGL